MGPIWYAQPHTCVEGGCLRHHQSSILCLVVTVVPDIHDQFSRDENLVHSLSAPRLRSRCAHKQHLLPSLPNQHHVEADHRPRYRRIPCGLGHGRPRCSATRGWIQYAYQGTGHRQWAWSLGQGWRYCPSRSTATPDHKPRQRRGVVSALVRRFPWKRCDWGIVQEGADRQGPTGRHCRPCLPVRIHSSAGWYIGEDDRWILRTLAIARCASIFFYSSELTCPKLMFK